MVRQVFRQLGRESQRPHQPTFRTRYLPVDWWATDCRSDRPRTENRGALETAHRALGNCGQVFRYAVATGRATRDPSGDLRGALPPVKGEHFAAMTEPKRVAELLRAMDGYEGTLTVRCALRLAPLVFVRPGELRKAEWADIDLDAAEWRYTVTKTSTPHIVPSPGRPWKSCANCIPSPGAGVLHFRERGATGDR